MRSLTGTLFKSVITATGLIFLTAGAVLFLSVRAQVVEQLDRSLTEQMRIMTGSVERKPYGLEVDLEEMRVEDMEDQATPSYLYIGSMDGHVIYMSPALEGHHIPVRSQEIAGDQFDWVKLPEGGRGRFILRTFVPDADDEENVSGEPLTSGAGIILDENIGPNEHLIFELIRDSSDTDRFLNRFMAMLMITGFGCLALLTLTVWSTIKRGAKPIGDLAAHIDTITLDDLTARVGEDRVFKELVPVVSKLNGLLARLEESFTREKGFTSDAAHELRTPLAGLKSTIEVSLTRERDGGEYRETLERALEIVNHLERLVQSLLTLARLESGRETADNSEINLENSVREIWLKYGEAADKKGVATSFSFRGNSTFSLDKDLLAQVLDELFKNAVHYVDSGGMIKISLFQDGDSTRLSIVNTGSKVSVEEGSHVFDRFWRGSQSRTDTGTRFGLGLPIVRKIVETIGGRVWVETEMDGEFVVTVEIKMG